MKDFISQYSNPNEDRINYGLIDREYDEDLVKLIAKSCKSLEVLQYVKFLGYEFIADEKEVDLNEYMTSRRKNRQKNTTRYMYLQDSRYVELRLKFRIECKGEADLVTKKLLIPIADHNGYYTIKGKKYLLLYQLVDSSTYTTRQNLTLKSLMPVINKRLKGVYTDTEGNQYTAPTYVIFIFKKEVSIMLFYFAKMGVTKTLKFWGVNDIIDLKDSIGNTHENIYFQVNSKMFLEVNKHFFLKFQYVQSMVFMILDVIANKNRVNFDSLDNKDFWIERIGSMNATNSYNFHEKGMNTLTFFNRMLDEITKGILKIDKRNKKSMYSVVRWMIQNFNGLRRKDNMDLVNKRLRCNEYIASLLTKAFSERVNRVITAGNKVNLDKVREIFKFPGSIIMEQLHMSGLLKYDDRINDMDFFGKLRFTLKGPNSLGGKSDNTISMKYRGIHPSYLGRLDINVCGTSDPGSSGIITPFCKTDGLYFDGSFEPEDGVLDFDKEVREKYMEENSDNLVIDEYALCDNMQEIFQVDNLIEKNRNKMSAVTIQHSKTDMFVIDVNVADEEEL